MAPEQRKTRLPAGAMPCIGATWMWHNAAPFVVLYLQLGSMGFWPAARLQVVTRPPSKAAMEEVVRRLSLHPDFATARFSAARFDNRLRLFKEHVHQALPQAAAQAQAPARSRWVPAGPASAVLDCLPAQPLPPCQCLAARLHAGHSRALPACGTSCLSSRTARRVGVHSNCLIALPACGLCLTVYPIYYRHRLRQSASHFSCLQCALCGEALLPHQEAHLDHRFLFSAGGTSDASNAQLVHAWCNRSKGARTDEEFRRRLGSG